jgi:hypothetical protein
LEEECTAAMDIFENKAKIEQNISKTSQSCADLSTKTESNRSVITIKTGKVVFAKLF